MPCVDQTTQITIVKLKIIHNKLCISKQYFMIHDSVVEIIEIILGNIIMCKDTLY